jgi:preprotein translocase subunit YajC
MDLQKGDRVRLTVTGTVCFLSLGGPDLELELDGHTGRYSFISHQVENIERISLKVGDPVVTIGGGLVRKILAIHEDYAWLDDGGDVLRGPKTYGLDQLRLAL